jgi:hypothetical protein
MTLVRRETLVRFEGNSIILTPEARELLRSDKPFKVLAEVWREALHRGEQQANKNWLKEANRRGGAVQWARLPRRRKARR